MKTTLSLILFLLLNLCFANGGEKLKTGQYLIEDSGLVECQLVGSSAKYKLNSSPILTTKHFTEASISYEATGSRKASFILIELTQEGQSMFKEFTRKNVGNTSGTVIGGRLFTAIVVQAELEIKFLEVQADVSKKEIKRLVEELNNEIKTNR